MQFWPGQLSLRSMRRLCAHCSLRDRACASNSEALPDRREHLREDRQEIFPICALVLVDETVKQLDRRHRAGEMIVEIVEITSKCFHAKIASNLHACSF